MFKLSVFKIISLFQNRKGTHFIVAYRSWWTSDLSERSLKSAAMSKCDIWAYLKTAEIEHTKIEHCNQYLFTTNTSTVRDILISQNKYCTIIGRKRETEKSLDEQNDGRKVSPSTFSSIPNPNNPLILFLISIRGLSLPHTHIHTHTHMHQCYSALQYALLRYTLNFMFSSPLSSMKPIWF